jgi:hypothetical protein
MKNMEAIVQRKEKPASPFRELLILGPTVKNFLSKISGS